MSTSSTQLPIVALIGRPNVGKSTLFNRLLGKRRAVISDEAGTTRDTISAEMSYKGRHFILMDMAGLEPTFAEAKQNTPEEILRPMQKKAMDGLNAADVVLWLVDVNEENHGADDKVSELLRQKKKVIIVANKCDNPNKESQIAEFYRFGVEKVVGISAIHQRGIDELLSGIYDLLPEEVRRDNDLEPDYLNDKDPERELRIGIVGRPNVGKSTLLNSLIGEDRSVVSSIAGTTRDTVDAVIPVRDWFRDSFVKWNRIRFIDTAGIRRRGKIGQSIESWSVLRSIEAIEEAQIILALLDANEGLTHQDMQVLQKVVDSGRPLIVLVNKWDEILKRKGLELGSEGEEALQDEYLGKMLRQVPFLHWVQVMFVSAKDSLNLAPLGKVVIRAYNAWNRKVTDEQLAALTEELKKYSRLNNLMKVEYQHARPPVFILHVEGRNLPHFSTIRFVENVIRENIDFSSTPIKIWTNTSLPKK